MLHVYVACGEVLQVYINYLLSLYILYDIHDMYYIYIYIYIYIYNTDLAGGARAHQLVGLDPLVRSRLRRARARDGAPVRARH